MALEHADTLSCACHFFLRSTATMFLLVQLFWGGQLASIHSNTSVSLHRTSLPKCIGAGTALRSTKRFRVLDETLRRCAKVWVSIRRLESSGILPMRRAIRRSAALSLSFDFSSVPEDDAPVGLSASAFLTEASRVSLKTSKRASVIAGSNRGCDTFMIFSRSRYDGDKEEPSRQTQVRQIGS